MRRVFELAAGAVMAAALGFSQAKPTIGVFVDFDSTRSQTSVEIMKREVASLLKSSGVSLDWRSASENYGDESFAGLVVLKFKGKCKAESWTDPGPGQAPTLGTTKVDDGGVLPVSEVRRGEGGVPGPRLETAAIRWSSCW